MALRGNMPWTLLMLPAGLSCALCGCYAPEHVEWKWPGMAGEEKVAPPVVYTDDVAPQPGGRDSHASRPPQETDTRKAASRVPRPRVELEKHRAAIWPRIDMLRRKEETAPEKRKALIEEAVNKLPEWYAPLDVEPPTPYSDNWISVMVWDFMPGEQYAGEIAKWKKIAAGFDKPFPDPVTRRKLLQLIEEIMAQTNETKEEAIE